MKEEREKKRRRIIRSPKIARKKASSTLNDLIELIERSVSTGMKGAKSDKLYPVLEVLAVK